MNARSLQELIRNLRIFYKCPSCASAYRHADILFLGRIEEHCFMQLTCQHCTLPILATILVADQQGISNVQMPPAKATKTTKPKNVQVTDLKPSERSRFKAASAIGSTEIAELYRYLSDHNSITRIIK